MLRNLETGTNNSNNGRLQIKGRGRLMDVRCHLETPTRTRSY